MNAWKAGFAMLGLIVGGCQDSVDRPADRVVVGDPDRGRRLVTDVGCNACHNIPGIRGPRGIVGPPLAGIASRPFLGGSVPNHPATMAEFVRNAPSLVPNTAMPSMPLEQKDAEDITAFLFSLR